MAASLTIIPVLILGVILGILEMVFVHKDEAGMGWLKHGFHAIPTMIIFIFISMNIDYVIGLVGWTPQAWMTIAIRVVVGLLAAIKIAAAAKVAGRVGEKLPHTLVIAALVMVAPFAWELLLCNIDLVKTLPMNGCPV
jgi:hypothetical protein